MAFVYRYLGRTGYGTSIEGQVCASGRADAEDMLRRMGLVPIDLGLDVGGTLGALGRRPDRRELARLYHTLGERLRNDSDMAAGLEAAAEFIEDVQLRASTSMWAIALRDGARTHEAMALAGFPPRHVAAVQALSNAGALIETFLALAEDCEREQRLTDALSRIARQPIVFGLLALLIIWGVGAFVLGPTIGRLAGLGRRGLAGLPPYVRMVAEFGQWAEAHPLLWAMAVAGFAIAVTVFVRSPAGRRLFDLLPTWRKISERSDMAALWGSFALLYTAGEPQDRAARLVAQAARREDVRDAFLALSVNLDSGRKLAEAVERAGFPRYVIAAVGQAANQHGGTAEALMRFARERAIDVDVLVDVLQVKVDLFLKLAMAALVIAIYAAAYLPMIIAAQSLN